MKYIILFLICATLNAQNTTSITYSVELFDEKEMFKSNERLRDYFEDAIKNSSNYKFKLVCNDSISKFYQIETMSFDQNKLGSKGYLAFFNYSGESYVDRDSIFSQSLIFGNKTYVKKKLKDNWVLTNETKIIEGFKCFKATNIYEVNNSLKQFKHPVTAWYCPELPYNFGPNGYCNLPGLILELQVRNYVYGAKKIDLNSNEKINFNKKEITIIDESKLEEKLKKFNEE